MPGLLGAASHDEPDCDARQRDDQTTRPRDDRYGGSAQGLQQRERQEYELTDQAKEDAAPARTAKCTVGTNALKTPTQKPTARVTVENTTARPARGPSR